MGSHSTPKSSLVSPTSQRIGVLSSGGPGGRIRDAGKVFFFFFFLTSAGGGVHGWKKLAEQDGPGRDNDRTVRLQECV